MTIAQNFEQAYKVDEETGCWNWIRGRKGKEAKAGGGYGCLKVGMRTVGAHAFSYERSRGKVPSGMQVAHQCHNTLCVNPAHLELQTNEQNQAAKAAAGRAPHRLTAEQVLEIRRRVAAGETQVRVAVDYDLKQGDVSHIVHGHYWKHVEEPRP
jgi:hypothetical protein